MEFDKKRMFSRLQIFGDQNTGLDGMGSDFFVACAIYIEAIKASCRLCVIHDAVAEGQFNLEALAVL